MVFRTFCNFNGGKFFLAPWQHNDFLLEYTRMIVDMKTLPREGPTVPDVPDDGHVVHTGLVTVSQLLEAHLRLAVHRVAALGLHS